ncbi:hypothetical protein Tco_1348440, partial [Tanacetum coccineum]
SSTKALVTFVLDWGDMMRYSLPRSIQMKNNEKCSGKAGLSKDTSGPEPPLELWRRWCVEGHDRSRVISSVLMQRYQRKLRQKLGDEGLSSEGTKLNSIFITAEVTFTKPRQPT